MRNCTIHALLSLSPFFCLPPLFHFSLLGIERLAKMGKREIGKPSAAPPPPPFSSSCTLHSLFLVESLSFKIIRCCGGERFDLLLLFFPSFSLFFFFFFLTSLTPAAKGEMKNSGKNGRSLPPPSFPPPPLFPVFPRLFAFVRTHRRIH